MFSTTKAARSILLSTLLLCIFNYSVYADEYDEAVKAYAAGQYQKAYKLFLPLARSGDEDAQFHLGLMYDNGLGVKQDHAVAEQWYDRACPLPAEGQNPQ